MTLNFPSLRCSSHIKVMTPRLNSLKGAHKVPYRISFSGHHLNSFPPPHDFKGHTLFYLTSRKVPGLDNTACVHLIRSFALLVVHFYMGEVPFCVDFWFITVLVLSYNFFSTGS